MTGTHQMLFVIAAMTLLTQITLTVNRYTGNNLQASLSSEATITGAALAQSMILEVSMKDFDEEVLTGPVTSRTDLTPPGQLGPDDGESYTNFDDLDDFDEYERTVTTPRMGNFRVRTEVWYARESDLEKDHGSAQFLKRVTVTVDQNPSLEYDITMTRIIPY